MMRSERLWAGWLLAAALVTGAMAGCASSTGAADGGGGDAAADASGGDAGGTDAGGRDAGDGDAGCPADPAAAVGTPCAVEGQSCGDCSDPCSFCNPLVCMNGRWNQVEVFPGQCDAGSVDAGGVACGTTTCAATEICVHTVSSGGPCLQPEDGGCPDGSHLSGSCCVYSSDSYQCAARPSGCNAALSCGCASELCGSGCSCQGATGEQLECGCFYP